MELNYEEFKEYIKGNIKSKLPEQYQTAEVDVHPVTKNNGIVLDGLTIHEEKQAVSPTIYLNDVYSKYQETGDLDEIVENVAVIYTNAMEQSPELQYLNVEEQLLSEKGRDLITFRISGYEANKEMLETMPYEQVGDMVMTYHIIANQTEDGIGSIRITDSLMAQMGLEPEELKSLALENTIRMYPPSLKSMMEVMREIMFGAPQEPCELGRELPEDNMYVLSNSMGINGATSLFYPNVKEIIAETLGCDYYVLPSSIHESATRFAA